MSSFCWYLARPLYIRPFKKNRIMRKLCRDGVLPGDRRALHMVFYERLSVTTNALGISISAFLRKTKPDRLVFASGKSGRYEGP